MPAMIDPPNYLAFLLRLWRIDSQGISTWRASLESPGTTMRHNFASLEALFAYLREGILETGAQDRPTDNQLEGFIDPSSTDDLG